LNKSGLETEVHIVGIKNLPLKNIPSYVKNYGFISKSSESGKKQIDELLAQSHFLILPSKADCTPIVFSEACSFGLPSISTKTGGIPTIIKDDINGFTFNMDAKIEDYANYISEKFFNYNQYESLVFSTFNEYKTRLNWEVAGKRIIELIKDL
jgi:glycosyltransferase involved in cell wall biosynthesis